MSTDKSILVTGSSRGIGAAIARKAHEAGMRVLLHGRSETDELKRIAEELKSEYVCFDVADAEAVERSLSNRHIDIVVNNAGINPSKTFQELTLADWHDIFNINVFGVVHVSRAVLPSMKKRKSGIIINIASIKGLSSVSGKPAYAAAKAAVIRMTASMAEEFAPDGVRVNAVAPGFTETEMTTHSMSDSIRAQINQVPLKRMAKPSDIAAAVLFLAGEDAGYITGQTLIVDGGYSIAG